MTDVAYSVRVVDRASDVPSELWTEGFAPSLEGQWWYETLERSGLEDQFTFLYAIIDDQGKPAGLAPLFVMDVPIALLVPPEILPFFNTLGKVFPSVKYQRTLFVGSPCSDEGTVGLSAGVDRDAALACLQSALEAMAKDLQAPMLVWKDFPAVFDGDLGKLAQAKGMFRLVSFPGAAMTLPSKNKADYYAAMKASRRQKIKRKLRISEASADLSVEIVTKPSPETLDEIFGLFSQTYEKAETKFERLGRTFFDVVAQQEPARFIVLREQSSGAMVAFMLCFALGERLINKFIGLDYRQPKEWALYFRLWDQAVDWALAHGFTSIQSGQTGYSAKIELGNDLIPLTNYCRHRNPLVHWIYRAVAKTVDWHTLDPDLDAHLKAHPEAPRRSVQSSSRKGADLGPRFQAKTG